MTIISKRWVCLFSSALAASLSGCATRQPPLYYWGNYTDQQYEYLKGAQGPEEGIQNLEKIKEQAKSKGRALPPGMQAHLGLLYGQSGRTDLFEQNMQAEKQAFPESAKYVDFLTKKKTDSGKVAP